MTARMTSDEILTRLAAVEREMDTLPCDDDNMQKHMKIAMRCHTELHVLHRQYKELSRDDPQWEPVRAGLHAASRRLLQDGFHVSPEPVDDSTT